VTDDLATSSTQQPDRAARTVHVDELIGILVRYLGGRRLRIESYEEVKGVLDEALLKMCRITRPPVQGVGYGIVAGGWFTPEGRLAKVLGVVVGFSTTWAC
jgi:hypothetical protein